MANVDITLLGIKMNSKHQRPCAWYSKTSETAEGFEVRQSAVSWLNPESALYKENVDKFDENGKLIDKDAGYPTIQISAESDKMIAWKAE